MSKLNSDLNDIHSIMKQNIQEVGVESEAVADSVCTNTACE